MNITPESPITCLYGISEARRKLYKKLDIETVDDLVHYIPRVYEDRGNVKKAGDFLFGSTISLILEVMTVMSDTRLPSRKGRPLTIQKFTAADETGTVKITFFNQSYLKNTFVTGRKFRFYGFVGGSLTMPEMISPSYEPYYEAKSLSDFVPVYSLTAGITSKMLSQAIKSALPTYQNGNFETLPEVIRNEYNLCDLYFALCNIHFPENAENLTKARRRLSFEELLNFQIRLRGLKSKEKKGEALKLTLPDMSKFYSSLPYTLTDAQKNCIHSILNDMTGENAVKGETISPMRRLVQGDVGSGKTIVAAAAVYTCAKCGCQSAMMVPTEILAEQHYRSLSPLMEKHSIKTSLLTGSTKPSEKKKILSMLEKGEIDFLIGTHALIEDKVQFSSLALVITDEQHRFGVKQREKLSQKVNVGEEKMLTPHMLVMSATPIPRTLALILYGDLDVSIIDELPPGRLKVDTFAVGESMRERVNKFIRKLVGEGRQVYIVCPLIENEEKIDEYIPYAEAETDDSMTAAVNYAEKLKTEVFPELRIAIIHGKLKAADKDSAMRSFVDGEIDILVSTTVIEVGVNVPNASLMIVENAERFGLSQLHQLRGRVGRGEHKSYCILISSVISSEKNAEMSTAEKRLKILCENESGFKIAESDLQLRGPGEFFGKRQHGELKFKIADIASDMALVEETKKLADRLCKDK